MDTLSVIALIVIALVILAVIIVYRGKLAVVLEMFGIKLNVQAEEAQRRGDGERDSSSPELVKGDSRETTKILPAGIRAEDLESGKGGIYIEEGRTSDPSGVGIEAKRLKADGDIIIGKGESGDPKAPPPA